MTILSCGHEAKKTDNDFNGYPVKRKEQMRDMSIGTVYADVCRKCLCKKKLKWKLNKYMFKIMK